MFEITAKEISDINELICATQSNSFAVRETNLLLSIPQGVNQSVFGEDAYPTIQDKIAYVVASIAKNHIFMDANKRTAVLVYMSLCVKYHLPAKSDNDLFNIVQKIATQPFDVSLTKSLLF